MVGDILQPTHLLFILVVALLVLGPKRLPEVGRALGRGLRDFRSAMSGEDRPEPTISASPDPTPTAIHEPAEPTAIHEPAEPTAIHEPTEHSSFGAEPPAAEPPTAVQNGEPAPSETEPGNVAAEPITTVTGGEPRA